MALTTLQPLAYAVAYVTFFFGTASIFLRFYCRQYVLKTWGVDDYFAVLVLMVSIGQQVNLHMFLYWGCGLHMDTLSSVQVLQILKWLFVEEVIYYSVHWVIKSAFLFFYLRLSPNPTFRKFVYIGVGLNGAIWIINVLMACFQCVPFDEILHPGTHPDAKCISRLALLIVPSILNIVEDFYILLLPISTVLHLQMPTRRKIAVLGVIAFGASSVIIACFRLIPLMELNASADTSWVLGIMVIVAALEIQFAVIAVNLPSLKALWTRLVGGSSAGSGQANSKQKAYKLSSLGKSKGSRESMTRLKRGITSTDSEEELFRQGGTALQLPIQGSKNDVGAIQVTKDFNVKSAEKDGEYVVAGYYPGDH
ncbi:hypothetical protein BDW02DRAFT_79083 [Decorospora gaudefroyi]|uniref:Rhodopsin domain-containing protein n=1 Tax=Decorospora gaudefroyi TaxID=184978 RepID=A0A6A5K0Q8_9PLEO|nr:hypothetical protein BDW02DRAFT_79083 [Decorospora gaudefroyi]